MNNPENSWPHEEEELMVEDTCNSTSTPPFGKLDLDH
jgi:hypothetical protein